MDNNYAVVETTRLAAVRGGAHIYSAIAEEDIQNGSVGYLGDLAENVEGYETYEFKTFDSDSLGKHPVVLVANPEWDYCECRKTNQALYNYINKAGKVFRVFDLIRGDNYGITAPGLDVSGLSGSEIEEGYYVITAEDTTKLKVVKTEAETNDSGFVGKIIGIVKKTVTMTAKNGTTYGRPSTMYLINIKRNTVTE